MMTILVDNISSYHTQNITRSHYDNRWRSALVIQPSYGPICHESGASVGHPCYIDRADLHRLHAPTSLATLKNATEKPPPTQSPAMPRLNHKILFCMLLVSLVTTIGHAEPAEPPTIEPPASLAEARARAMLLHETMHGTLQVVHRDFFLEDESRLIPSASLEDVFHSLEETYDVRLKWLVVETDEVNVDHQAETPFEKEAVKALAQRKPYWDSIENDRYQFAGPIRLASQCLKCHVRNRKDTKDRTAGLVISMPVAPDLKKPDNLRGTR